MHELFFTIMFDAGRFMLLSVLFVLFHGFFMLSFFLLMISVPSG